MGPREPPLAPLGPASITPEADRDGQSGGNNPACCHPNARAMRRKILCFQNVLSAMLSVPPNGMHGGRSGEAVGCL